MRIKLTFIFKLLLVSLLTSLFGINCRKQVNYIEEQRTVFWDNWSNKCFPDKDWSKTTFKTSGENYNAFKVSYPDIYNDMKALNSNEIKLQEFVESGSSWPQKVFIKAGDNFFKIVPKGFNINGPSVYYLSPSQLSDVKAQSEKLEQIFGLPLSSVSAEYDIFEIIYINDKGYVFQSRVAPTEQFANMTPNVKYLASGGGIQTLILDNMDVEKWKKSASRIGTLNPSKLPDIGNQK